MEEKKEVPTGKSDEVYGGSDDFEVQPATTNVLSRNLQGRHMQMIAIGMILSRQLSPQRNGRLTAVSKVDPSAQVFL